MACVRLRPVYKYMLPGQPRQAMLGTGLFRLDNILLHIHQNVTALVNWGDESQHSIKQVNTEIIILNYHHVTFQMKDT